MGKTDVQISVWAVGVAQQGIRSREPCTMRGLSRKSPAINASRFHSTWLGTFRTARVHIAHTCVHVGGSITPAFGVRAR